MTRKTNKISDIFSRFLHSKKALLVVCIMLPVLIVSSGFAAWIVHTPYVESSTTGGFTSESLINTTDYLKVNSFTPSTQEIYYTGPVDGEHNVVNVLSIDSNISLYLSNIYEIARDKSPKKAYLRVLISLKSGRANPIFQYDNGGTLKSHFSCDFSPLTVTSQTDTVKIRQIERKFTESSYMIMLEIDYTAVSSSTFDVTANIAPSFVLDQSGYASIFDLIKGGNETFMLDLKLSETDEIF